MLKFLLILAAAVAITGCATHHTPEADAIDLCGSIGKLQAANTHMLSDVDSFLVQGKAETKITYPELTPELRASAMRSTAHCINLRLGSITPEVYDKLMTLEATNAAAAENSLTNEQLTTLIGQGYTRIADILAQAGVSRKAIATVADAKAAELPPMDIPRQPGISPEMAALGAITSKVGGMDSKIDTLPAKVALALQAQVTAAGAPQPILKVLFSPRKAALDAEALSTLHKTVPFMEPDVSISVVGSADAAGDPLRNLELSRLRAQSVAAWLMVHRGIEPSRIHIGAIGSATSNPDSAPSRSVIIYRY